MKRLSSFDYLTFLLSADIKVQKGILESAEDNFIQLLGEIALNILSETIELSNYFKTKLQKIAWFIRLIGSEKVKPKARRKLCIKYINFLILMLKAVKPQLKHWLSVK